MNTYECPPCQFKNFNVYFTNLESIVPPKLIPYAPKDQEYLIEFKLTDDQRSKVTFPSDLLAMRCLIIRCLRIDSKGYEHHWPMNCGVEIYENNNKYGGRHVIFNQTFIWKKTPPRAHPRVDFPICYKMFGSITDKAYHFYSRDTFDDISKIKLNKPYTIKLKNLINLNPDDKNSYVISVDIVEINKINEQVLRKIKTFSEPKQLKLLMKKNEDFLNYEIVSFICQYSCKRISLPGRGYDCLHLQVIILNKLIYFRYSIY